MLLLKHKKWLCCKDEELKKEQSKEEVDHSDATHLTIGRSKRKKDILKGKLV